MSESDIYARKMWDLTQSWVRQSLELWDRSLDGQVIRYERLPQGTRVPFPGTPEQAAANRSLLEMTPEQWGIFPVMPSLEQHTVRGGHLMPRLPVITETSFHWNGESNWIGPRSPERSRWILSDGRELVKIGKRPVFRDEFSAIVFRVSARIIGGINDGIYRVEKPVPVENSPIPDWWESISVSQLNSDCESYLK